MKYQRIWILLYLLLVALLCGYTTSTIAEMATQEKTVDLVVTGVIDDTLHRTFVHDHPELNVTLKQEYLRSSGKLVQSLLSRDDSFDVMVLFTGNHDVGTLIRKGYCRPLDDSEDVMQVIGQMYPVFSNVVMKEGVPYGLPLEAYIDTLAYDAEAFAALGLEPPTSWDDIVSLINSWPSQPDDIRERYQVASTTDYRKWVLRGIVDSYVYHAQCNNQQLSFMTEAFRHLMTLQSSVSTENDLEEEDSAIDELTPLLYSGLDILSMDWQRYRPLVLEWNDGLADSIRCRLFIAFINPGTRVPEAALTYITYLADHMSEKNQILLLQGQHSPVETPHFDRWMEDWMERQAMLEANLAQAKPEDQSDLQRLLDEHKVAYDELLSYRYEISEEDIEAYNSFVDRIWVSSPSLLDDQGDDAETFIDSILNRYLDGYYTDIDVLINKIEETVMAINGERGE